MQTLQTEMMLQAEATNFEQAAEIRNQITALSRVLHQQSVEDNSGHPTKDADILAVKVHGGRANSPVVARPTRRNRAESRPVLTAGGLHGEGVGYSHVTPATHSP